MKVRNVVATVLAVISVPLFVLGLIDPLEGGIALLAAVALVVVARVLSGVPVPKLLWIPALSAIGVGVLTLTLAVLNQPTVQTDGAVLNPLGAAVIPLLWTYRGVMLVTIAGGVMYLVHQIRALRSREESHASREPLPARTGGRS